MKKTLLPLLLLFLSLPLSAQVKMEVLSKPELVAVDAAGGADAQAYYRQTDVNDQVCAILKVTLTNAVNAQLVLHTAGGLAPVAPPKGQSNLREDGEWWFWLSPQVRNISFSCAGYTATKQIGTTLKPGRVYRMKLAVDAAVRQITEHALTETYLRLDIYPRDVHVLYGESRQYTGEVVLTDGQFDALLAPGMWYYRIQNDLYEPYEGECELDEQTPLQTIRLQPAYGLLHLETEPSGATVSLSRPGEVSAVFTGKTPCTTPALKKGEYTLRANLENYKMVTLPVTVPDDGAELEVPAVSLPPQFGTVVCLCEDETAELVVTDAAGRVVSEGRSGMRLQLNSAKDYKLEARKASHSPQSVGIRGLDIEGREKTVSVGAPVPLYGVLSLTSDPKRAEVYVDGVYLDVTPLTRKVLIGRHTVECRKEGWSADPVEVEISRNEAVSLNIALQEGPRQVWLTLNTVEDAEIWCDGRRLSATSSWSGYLDVGKTYHLESVRSHSRSGELNLSVKANSPSRVDIPAPQWRTGYAKISTGGVKSWVEVTGENFNRSQWNPSPLWTLTEGQYTVHAYQSGYEDATATFQVTEGETVPVNLRLRRPATFFLPVWTFSPACLNYLLGWNIGAKEFMAGLHFTWCKSHLGFYGSALFGTQGQTFSVNAGPVFRLTSGADDVDVQLYGGVGYYGPLSRLSPYSQGELGGELGLRLGWDMDSYYAVSPFDLTVGVQASPYGWTPTLGLGYGIPFFPLFLEEPKNFSSFFTNFSVGYGIELKDWFFGAQMAWCKSHLGLYASTLFGVKSHLMTFNIGPVLRLTNDFVDLQLYGGGGFVGSYKKEYSAPSVFGWEAGLRIGWVDSESIGLSFFDITLGAQGSAYGLIPVVNMGLGIPLFLFLLK